MNLPDTNKVWQPAPWKWWLHEVAINREPADDGPCRTIGRPELHPAVAGLVRVAVVGEFTTALAGDRVRYIPFVSKPSFMDVGLLYRKSDVADNVNTLITASLDFKERSKGCP